MSCNARPSFQNKLCVTTLAPKTSKPYIIGEELPFSSINQEKKNIEHKYVIGSMLAKKAISVFVQLKTILAVVAIGPYVFHAQYWLKLITENNNRI